MSTASFVFASLLNSMAESWQNGMLRACWQGGLFLAGVWVVCRTLPCLRFRGQALSLPTNTRAWLWWAVCLKLVVGLFWTTPLALHVLPPAPPSISPVKSAPAIVQPEPLATASLETQAEAAPLPVSRKQPAFSIPPSSFSAQARENVAPVEKVSPVVPPLRIAAFLLPLWAVVTGWQLVRAGKRWNASWRLVQTAAPVQKARTLGVAQEMAARMGLKRVPRLVESDLTAGPLVMGLFQPVVVLPHSIKPLTDAELRMALAHEFAHLKRGDLWLSLLPTFTCALFFFFPPVWLAAREFALAREEACDLEALRVTGAPARDYGVLLLKVASQSSASPVTAALGVASNFRTLERRLKMLQQYSSVGPTCQVRAVIVLALGIGAICVLPWRLAAQEPQVAAPKPTPTTEQKVIITEAKPATSKTLRAAKPATAGSAVTVAQAKPAPSATPAIRAITIPGIQLKPEPPLAPATETAPIATTVDAAKPGEEAIATAPVATPAAISIAPQAKPVPGTQAVPLIPTSPAVESAKPAALPITPTVGIAAPAAIASKPIAGRGPGAVSIATPAELAKPSAAPTYGIKTVGIPVYGITTARSVQGDIHPGRVSLNLRDATFYDALTSILSQSGVNFRIDEDVARIARANKTTISFSDVPLDKALDMLLRSPRTRAQSLTYVKEGGLYIIVPAQHGGSGGRQEPATEEKGVPILKDIPIVGDLFRTRKDTTVQPISNTKPADVSDIMSHNVTIKAEEADLRKQLKQLFESEGVSYAFDAKLGEMGKITMSLQNRPFRNVLETILRQSKTPVTYLVEGGTITIVPKPKNPEDAVQSIQFEAYKEDLKKLLSRRTELQGELTDMKRMYSDNHPLIQQCQGQLISIDGRIARLEQRLQTP